MLADALGELGIIIRPLELPDDMPKRAMSLELDRRTAFYHAALLGIQFDPKEKPSAVKRETLYALPDILTTKGLVEGATIHKNFGGNPELPHKILDLICST